MNRATMLPKKFPPKGSFLDEALDALAFFKHNDIVVGVCVISLKDNHVATYVIIR